MKKRISIILIVLTTVIMAGIFKYYTDAAETAQLADNTIRQIIEGEIPPDQVDYKSLGKFEPFVREFSEGYLKYRSDINNLKEEWVKVDFEHLLDQKHVENLIVSKEKLKESLDKISNYEDLIVQDVEQMQNSFDKAPYVSEKDKKEFAEVFASETQLRLKIIQDTTSTMNIVFAEVDSIYDMLIDNSGKYVLEDGFTVFSDSQIADLYNQHVQKVNDELQEFRGNIASFNRL